MRCHPTNFRSLVLVSASLVIGFGLLAPSSLAAANLHTYRAAVDVDNKSATGCNFSLGSIPPIALPGFELQITVVVDQEPNPPQVASAVLETCAGAVFADPQPLAGFVLELDSGVLGADSVVGSIPLSLLGGNPVIRLAFHALSSDGAEDALFTTSGGEQGLPIVVVLSIPAAAPLLSNLGLALLILVLLAVALRASRMQRGVLSGVALLALSAAAVAYAAFGEPVAVDDPADSVPADTRSEIIAAFAMKSNSQLSLRLDVEDIPTEVVCDDGMDNDVDGLVDCEDPDCQLRSCNDQDGCTLNDRCSDFACVGESESCEDGNECTLDTCVSVSPDPGNGNFVCERMLAADKTDFGSCTPEGNCDTTRAPDGTCGLVLDACILGRCTVGAEDVVTCEGANKVDVPETNGGCDDENPCTADSCVAEGMCQMAALDGVACDDGALCTANDMCVSGECVGTPGIEDCSNAIDDDCDLQIDEEDSDCS